MTEKVKIAVDLMGGENSPDKNLEGINLFVEKNQKNNDYFFYFFGDEEKIISKLYKY